MKKLLPVILFLTMVGTASASGIPTVDVVNNVFNVTDLMESIGQTMNQVEQITNQVKQIKNQALSLSNQAESIIKQGQQIASMTGNYDMGKFLNGKLQKELRRYTPNNWYDVKRLCKKSGVPTNLKEAVEAAKKSQEEGEQYPTDKIFKDADQTAAVRYENEGDRLYSTMGLSQAAYNGTEKHLTDIEQMGDKIDSANDLKAAVDLGNRIGTENALLTTEMIRQTSILNIQETEKREEERNRMGAEMAKCDMTVPSLLH